MPRSMATAEWVWRQRVEALWPILGGAASCPGEGPQMALIEHHRREGGHVVVRDPLAAHGQGVAGILEVRSDRLNTSEVAVRQGQGMLGQLVFAVVPQAGGDLASREVDAEVGPTLQESIPN